ncbi:heparinase II/III family protein [Tenuifilum thalassicum]|uniref:Heparinase n=1 Tax=Tenuifilum thalassicum TaxID=2590900 RepID=A0A7D4C8A5_9BACT|nr:heparinase II/III family protein [Tenuifilum thalassicum]QKG79462.1 heparinase [Tenuifilum thalassicum]
MISFQEINIRKQNLDWRSILFCLSLLIALLFSSFARSQDISKLSKHVPSNNELIGLLNLELYPELKPIANEFAKGNEDKALKDLADYFKERFSERYFFSWKNFDQRFKEYNSLYSGREKFHAKKAAQHMDLYPAYTQWKIGFENLKGETVKSYPYRHLTRQHSAPSIALMYHYSGDVKFLNYIPEQARSLNVAFNRNEYETIKDGNGAFEAYRAGNRMFNWLMAHQILLASESYTTEQQIEMIRTFVHTANQLYIHNKKYREGNHQTRGMSALAMLSILLPEFKGAEQWQKRAFDFLEEHLEKEVYLDGFQFERTVHYHVDDIDNYFYPWQLAKLNGVQLNPIWDQRVPAMFDVLLKIALPNKKCPVLQDDTDKPLAEFNQIDDVMALGVALFGEPQYKYFASSKISSNYYWFLRSDQIDRLTKTGKKKPQVESCSLPNVGYYVMRNGWSKKSSYAIISAGLTPEKPDHQHGDMLGIQVYANENVLLPNYQVRYYQNDLPQFKNSWTKNVALADSIPQGNNWKGNKGSSGFGKYLTLPKPKVIAWKSNNEFDLFIGSHNGYVENGIETYRTVFFFKKGGFWFVDDYFVAIEGTHSTQQVWQGHYDMVNNSRHIQSIFPNGSGLEIIQLGSDSLNIVKGSARSKGRLIFSKNFIGQTNWNTLLLPFNSFDNQLSVKSYDSFKYNGWSILQGEKQPKKIKTDARVTISKSNRYLLINATFAQLDDLKIDLNTAANIWVSNTDNSVQLTNCSVKTIKVNGIQAEPGETLTFKK